MSQNPASWYLQEHRVILHVLRQHSHSQPTGIDHRTHYARRNDEQVIEEACHQMDYQYDLRTETDQVKIESLPNSKLLDPYERVLD